MKICDDLRQTVLQAAIQGKLTTQRQEDGDARELLKQIAVEKAQLIKNGKIKKEKTLPEISEDEKPFDIPENWVWCYTGDLFDHNTGKAMNSSAKKVNKPGSIRKFITTSNLYWNTFDMTTVKEMFFSDEELERCTVTKGDLLMCEGGAYYGRTAIWNYDYDICFQNHIHRLRPFLELDLMYFYYLYYFYKNTGMMNAKGTAMPGLSSIALHHMPVSLPPLKEQHRIVAKVDMLMAEIDELEKVENELVAMKDAFPGDMKAALLQAAMQGKLTTQRKEDGDARDLLEQIDIEKAKLIKEGKLKKEKPLAEITEDEKPFDIPDNWEWVRLPDVATSSLGKTLNKEKDKGTTKEYLCSINIYWDGISLDKVKTASFSDDDIEKYRLEKGDLLICEGGDVGRSAIWDSDKEMYYQNALHRVRFYGNINQYYFLYVLKLYKHTGLINDISKGETIKHLVQSSLYSLLFPLPPLAEQERIVAKLDKLLPLCENLKEA